MGYITTLREMFIAALAINGETWESIIGRTILCNEEYTMPESIYANPKEDDWMSHPFTSNEQYKKRETLADLTKEQLLDLEFDGGYGAPCPIKVTLWTDKNVYFNYEYDGADFVITKPRNPPNTRSEDQ